MASPHNPTEHYPTPLESFYHWEATQGDTVYLTQPWAGGEVENFTWSEVGKQARSMAAYLQSLKLEPCSQIALMSSNCAYWFMTDLAIMMAGHVSVPIYPTSTQDEMRYILEHSESKVLFVGKMENWEQVKSGVPLNVPVIGFPPHNDPKVLSWKKIVAETEPLSGKPDRDLDELATIVYTSGSTGTPKGVMIQFRNIAMAAKGAGNLLELTPRERAISYLPLSHVYDRYAIEMNSFKNGFRVFFAHSLDTFLDDLQRARPTIFCSVPRLWIKFQMGVFEKVPQEKLDKLLSIPIVSFFIRKKVLKGLGLDAVRYAASGASPIAKSLLAWYQKLGLEIIEGYGMTENFAYSHQNLPGNIKIGSVGISNPMVETKIDENGEVLIKSPTTMLGYFKDAQKTKETLTDDGFLRTGDLGKLDEQGRLMLIGRVKEQFKTTKGKYIAPAPIEEKILGHEKIEMACLCGVGLSQPICLLNLSEAGQQEYAENPQPLLENLEQFLDSINQNLLSHQKVEKFIIVGENWLPDNGFLTPTLKLKRHVIEKHYGASFEEWFNRPKAVVRV